MTIKTELYQQNTGILFVYLLTVNHVDLEQPLRFTNNTFPITSNGDIYQAWPFDIVLPDQGDGKIPRAQIVFDAVDNNLVLALRSLGSPPSISISIVDADTPNVIEKTFSNMTIVGQAYTNDYRVSLTIGMLDIANERAQNLRFDKTRFPGLFPK